MNNNRGALTQDDIVELRQELYNITVRIGSIFRAMHNPYMSRAQLVILNYHFYRLSNRVQQILDLITGSPTDIGADHLGMSIQSYMPPDNKFNFKR